MKVWKTDETGGVKPHQIDEPLRFFDSADGSDEMKDPNWIHDLIEAEWPDNQITWIRSCMRSTALCQNPASEEWQCGSFGPNGRWCKRFIDHRGKCSDIFLPEDRNNVTKRLKALQDEEMDAILGKQSSPRSRKINLNKLKEILKQEGR